MTNKNDSSKLKSTLLICSTLITFASLVLNVVQYQSNKNLQAFELASKYPAINAFRVKLSKADIERVGILAQEGIEFSYISNPSFLFDEKFANKDDELTTVEFLTIANNSDLVLSNLRFIQASNSFSELTASHLSPHSTLLIPERIYASPDNIEVVSNISQISYDFSIGGNDLEGATQIQPASDEVVVFEIGLGAISLSSFDFEDK